MGYLKGLGGAESCGPNQVWDPKYVFCATPGDCLPPGQCVPKPATTAAASSGGVTDVIKSIGSAIFGAFTTQAKAQGQSAAYQQYIASQQQGPSLMVPLAIGAAGLVAAVLILRK